MGIDYDRRVGTARRASPRLIRATCQDFIRSPQPSNRVSVCRIELFLLSDSQEVHEAGHTGHPEDRCYHVDDSVRHVPAPEGEVCCRRCPQAAGYGAHDGAR